MMGEDVPDVVVNSVMVPNPGGSSEHFSFSLQSPVSGVSASGTVLTFQPGSHIVRINLPATCSGEGNIIWELPNGTPITPPPAPTGVSPQEGDTWVQFGVLNTGENTTFSFNLGADSIGSTKIDFDSVGPTIVSDPPPSLVFQSS